MAGNGKKIMSTGNKDTDLDVSMLFDPIPGRREIRIDAASVVRCDRWSVPAIGRQVYLNLSRFEID